MAGTRDLLGKRFIRLDEAMAAQSGADRNDFGSRNAVETGETEQKQRANPMKHDRALEARTFQI
ncbi:MAG: hypothetical protein AB9873_00525 [Syntrophobacteraceae bacterium]